MIAIKRFTASIIAAVFAFSGCAGNDNSDSSLPSAAVSFKENATVSYLGPEGTYTEEAAKYFFSSTGSFIPKATVDEAIEDAAAGVSDYAVIPQENTLGGAVTNYVDALLSRDDVYVVGANGSSRSDNIGYKDRLLSRTGH